MTVAGTDTEPDEVGAAISEREIQKNTPTKILE